jgi:hypothetical protein
MNILQDQYAELVRLTRRFILQEHNLKDRLLAEAETYTYFRNYAAKKVHASSVQEPSITLPSAIKSLNTTQATTSSTTGSPSCVQITNSNPEPNTLNLVKEKPLPPLLPEKRSNLPSLNGSDSNSFSSKANESKEDNSKNIVPSKAASLDGNLDVKAESKGNAFVPEAYSSAGPVDVSEVRKILEKHTSIHFLDVIPSDIEAKKKARSWEEARLVEVLILTFKDSLKHHTFLENLRFAIETLGWNAKIVKGADVENNKKWGSLLGSKSLHLIVATSDDIKTSSELKKLYREDALLSKHTLGGVPLLLLADPMVYMAEPQQKQLLWNSVKESLIRPS